jgi:hypothetical protein
MTPFLDPKFVIAYTIILGFALAYIHEPSETMNGALIAAFAGAWGFYLGSSNSSSVIREQAGKALDLALSTAPTPPQPDIALKPGETATVGTEPPEEPRP